jgi:AcrR family transcriptional regulator
MPKPAPPKDLTARRGYHHGNLREALLEATRRLVAERGPRGFTLAEAARRAGVSPSAPYRHFKDREEVLRALSARGFALFCQRLKDAAAAAAASPEEAVRRMGPAYLAFAREEPGYYAAMFNLGGTDPSAGPAATGGGAPGDGPFAALVEAITAVLPEQGGPDPHLVALQVWALSHGVAMLERAGVPSPGSAVPSAEAVLASGVDALLLRPPDPG